jgi:uncharacterized membrane protein
MKILFGVVWLIVWVAIFTFIDICYKDADKQLYAFIGGVLGWILFSFMAEMS